MIIYNVTVSVDADIADEWLDWMRTTHIPDVMATGLFLDHRLCRVLNVEDEGRTFAIQYTLADMATYDRYATEHAPRLQNETRKRYEGRFVAFRTLLEVIHTH